MTKEDKQVIAKNIVIISGPSGAGEDSIIKAVLKDLPAEKIVSTTTREMRAEDEEGVTYYFVSKEEFKKVESLYNTWLYKHPKGDHNYKSFSHMRRSIEFAKYYSQKIVKNLSISGVVKSFTAEEVANELKDCETIDDAIRYFEDMK
jgi:guanylate kinase